MKAIASIILAASALAHPGHDHGDEGDSGRPSAVLRTLGGSPEAYNARTAALAEAGVPAKYGEEEWESVILTHEFHQHVGIYTILGAKMAVRAREVLDAPMRSVHVVAESGLKQPVSCMADGLQVGLGSTLGQNLIRIPETETPVIAAIFSYQDRSIRLRLSDEAGKRVSALIAEAVERHGNLTPAYFAAIEDASYEIWAEFDRNAVFVVEEGAVP